MEKIIIIILILGSFSFAFGQSTVGDSAYVTFRSYAESDSARAYFGYPANNLYRSVKLIPLLTADSMLLRGRTALDSVGDHYVEIRYYLQGRAVTNYYIGKWLNIDPDDYKATGFLTPSDSSLYMRTDWADIKNQNAQVNFNRTHIGYVDTVDSINEEITASVDTSQIKAMNVNNKWGASYIWSYTTRTLTSGTGTGVNQVILTTKQSSDSTPIASAQVQVLNYEQTATIGLLTTNPSGRATFALDDATYKVRMFKPGWQFTVPESLVVSGNTNKTYYAGIFNPGTPPSAEYCLVYGWVDTLGLPVSGATVVASIDYYPLYYGALLLNPYARFTTTDSMGYWELNLYINSLLTPATTKYQIWIYIPQGNLFYSNTVIVPNQPSWRFTY
jgi:hypothetical protein